MFDFIVYVKVDCNFLEAVDLLQAST